MSDFDCLNLDKVTKPRKPIPPFASEAEEREFWETQDSTEYLGWSAAQRVVFSHLKPSRGLNF